MSVPIILIRVSLGEIRSIQMPMKIGMVSLGCPKNLVDSEVMLGLAQQQGHELTRDAADADVLVVNTCAFIDKAKQESIDTILEMAEHKKTGACRRLIVTGCMAERYRDELRAQIPEIDAVLGTARCRKSSVRSGVGTGRQASALIPLLRANGELDRDPARPTAAESRALPTYIYDAETPRLLATPRHYAYVKIAEGCDYKCAFCIIPTLRGNYRSRPLESIVREAETLAAHGVKELLLISQDTSFYGIDRGERGALARLLRALNASTASNGSGCSTCIRRRSATTCSRRWRRARRSASTSTCRCSTRRTPC